jgi:hypothetical protein
MDEWVKWIPAPILLAIAWGLLRYFTNQILKKLESVDQLHKELADLKTAIKDFVTQEQFQALKERVLAIEFARKPRR